LLDEIWPQVEAPLAEAPDLEIKMLFEYLWERSNWEVQEKYPRIFQRRVKLWRLNHGRARKCFFSGKNNIFVVRSMVGLH
jgi:hypothetical protein